MYVYRCTTPGSETEIKPVVITVFSPVMFGSPQGKVLRDLYGMMITLRWLVALSNFLLPEY